MPPLVKLRGIKKHYLLGKTRIEALRGVDFTMERGELCCLMGPSGSGKTTLLNLIGCLDVATEGSYELAGRPVSAHDFDDLAEIRSRELGFIFQNFNLLPVLNVWENVELSALCSGKGSVKERRAQVGRMIDAVGLTRFAKHRPDELSGGQRQRVAIARALASAPSLILADEPTASLDTETARSITELLLQLNRDAGTTILFSTHDPRILSYARRIVYLRDGKIDERTDSFPGSVTKVGH